MPSMWKRAMVYLGLADDEDYADYGDYEEGEPQVPPGTPARGYGAPAPPYGAYSPEAGMVRTIGREEGPVVSPLPPEPSPFQGSAVRTIPAQPSQHLHVVSPTDFNEGAKEVGDKFKAEAPVIMNLSLTDKAVAKRLLDFASGLTYGLSGRMRRVGEGVFLLTPSGVEVSAEDKRRLQETGILFDGLDR